MRRQEEQQKNKKKKKSTKKKAIVIEELPKASQDSSSPEHTVDDGSLTDPEFNTGTVKSPGGPQPMAPGVFLSQRRPSISSPNNSSNSMSTTSSSMAKVERGVSADAKGEPAPHVQSRYLCTC